MGVAGAAPDGALHRYLGAPRRDRPDPAGGDEDQTRAHPARGAGASHDHDSRDGLPRVARRSCRRCRSTWCSVASRRSSPGDGRRRRRFADREIGRTTESTGFDTKTRRATKTHGENQLRSTSGAGRPALRAGMAVVRSGGSQALSRSSWCLRSPRPHDCHHAGQGRRATSAEPVDERLESRRAATLPAVRGATGIRASPFVSRVFYVAGRCQAPVRVFDRSLLRSLERARRRADRPPISGPRRRPAA